MPKLFFMRKIYFLLVVLFGFGSVSGQNIVFTDANFKSKLLNTTPSDQSAVNLEGDYFNVDANSDGEIDVNEALEVKELYFDGVIGTNDLQNLSGIEYFTSLTYLNVSFNEITGVVNLSALVNLETFICNSNQITGINVSNLSNLKNIRCFGNEISTLNLTGLTSLEKLYCANNLLTTLDATSCINLQEFNCSNNSNLSTVLVNGLSNLTTFTVRYCPIASINLQGLTSIEKLNLNYTSLTSLDVSGLTTLFNLDCRFNTISSLNLVGATSLTNLMCSDNMLTTIDLSGLTSIATINCSNNQLTTLDFSDLFGLTNQIALLGNPLESLFIKNGSQQGINFYNVPTIQYVCADEFDFIECQTCEINSYCTFESGTTGYVINGVSTFNANGCDDVNDSVANLKLNISNEAQTASFSTNNSGLYSIPVQAATHTITPVLEHPSYFNVSPASVTVTFPATNSPFIQNFCVTPNGVHQDLEVTIMPLGAAVPGFDADYKIVYRNIGNVNIAMGSVAFDYNDATLDYVSSSPITEVLPVGSLFWTFLNLQPFETRTIEVTFNLNSPTETPALISGNFLTFEANVDTSVGEDTNPIDNVMNLRQTVVNSFDPNDKTCLEGTEITPDKIGEYVHYMIRFENTGTFPAQNIVVKDLIDEEKFDISSLVPLNASHSFKTIIKYSKVEFIFENINLPFEDATNDGYIVFKIKTLPTLVVGNSFSNSASIYFDYNFPIVTDPAVTTFAVLGNEDFQFNKYLTVYPNPVNNLLKITSKQNIELRSMEIYNMMGQLVISVPNANGISAIDVSNLGTGNYILKVVSNKGTSNVKFIKN